MDLQPLLAKLFANAGAVGVEGVFQFVFGPQLAYWCEAAAQPRTESGRHAAPDVTIEVTTQDLLGIMAGSANVEELSASGPLKIAGNLGLATLLPQIIDQARKGVTAQKTDMNQRHVTPPRYSEQVPPSETFAPPPMADFINSLDTPQPRGEGSEPPAYIGNNILPAQLLELIEYPPYFGKNSLSRQPLQVGNLAGCGIRSISRSTPSVLISKTE